MVTTMLVMQHKAPMEPATTDRHPVPPGEDPPKDTWLSHMFRAWEDASSVHAASLEFKHILKTT